MELIFHQLIVFVMFVLVFADEHLKVLFYIPLPPRVYIGIASFVILPFHPHELILLLRCPSVITRGHLPSPSCSLHIGVVYSNAQRDGVVVRQGSRNNFYSHFSLL